MSVCSYLLFACHMAIRLSLLFSSHYLAQLLSVQLFVAALDTMQALVVRLLARGV